MAEHCTILTVAFQPQADANCLHVVSHDIQFNAVLDERFSSNYDLIEASRRVQNPFDDRLAAAGEAGFFNRQDRIALPGCFY